MNCSNGSPLLTEFSTGLHEVSLGLARAFQWSNLRHRVRLSPTDTLHCQRYHDLWKPMKAYDFLGVMLDALALFPTSVTETRTYLRPWKVSKRSQPLHRYQSSSATNVSFVIPNYQRLRPRWCISLKFGRRCRKFYSDCITAYSFILHSIDSVGNKCFRSSDE
nr:hypothetical protein CFP56_20491 [Quercus suber]